MRGLLNMLEENDKEKQLNNDETYESISSKIYEVRGVKVMLDFELAELYGYETKVFNRQVKNNIEKFDDTFRFQLNELEWKEILMSKFLSANSDDLFNSDLNLRCKNFTSSLLKQKDVNLILRSKNSTSSLGCGEEEKTDLMLKNSTANVCLDKDFNTDTMLNKLAIGWGGRRHLPYAFTEEGIYMLMTVLKGELATQQSIKLIKTFKLMKDFIIENSNLLTYSEARNLSIIVKHHDKQINTIENQLEEIISELHDDKVPTHYLILNGQRLEADVAYQIIYQLAKHTLFVIDDYIDVKTLQLLKCCDSKVKITIFTDNKSQNSLSGEYLRDFQKDTSRDISIKKNNGKFHDRYIVLDFGYKSEKIYHSGGSSKDAGNNGMTIDKINDIEVYNAIITSLFENEEVFKRNNGKNKSGNK